MDQASVPFGVLDIVGRMLIAIVAGAIVGADRELQRKPAGIRTHALVAMGSSLFTMIGLIVAADPMLDLAAPGRVIQGVIAGVGFIGAGAIFRREGTFSSGHGLTTAASVWIVAAVGTAAGAGLWRTAFAAVVLAILILLLEEPVDRLMRFISRRGADKDV